MFIKDYEYGFQCYVPDEFSEVKKENFEAWGVADSTLHYFVELDDNGEVYRAFSINLLDKVENNEDFEEVVNKNLEDIQSIGLLVDENEDLQLLNNVTVRRVLSHGEEDEYFVTYFAKVKDNCICSTIDVEKEYGEQETVIATVYSSLEEI